MLKSIAILLLTVAAVASTEPADKDLSLTFIPDPQQKIDGAVITYRINGEPKKVEGKLEDGKWVFRAEVPYVVKAKLGYKVFTGGGFAVRNESIILQPGNIIVDMSKEAKIYSGSKLQDELTRFYELSRPLWDKYFPDMKSVTVSDPAYADKYAAFLEEKNRIWEQYFEENKNPYVTAFNLENYVGMRWEHLDKAERYFNKLPSELKNHPDIKDFGERLMNTIAVRPGAKVPELTLPDANGKNISISSFRGKYVLIDFWASWCKPCREEGPTLKKAYEQYRSKGLEILGVSFDTKQYYTKWLKAMETDGYVWANVVDVAGMSDSDVAKRFNVQSIPQNLLLDKNGVIIGKNLHGKQLEEKLAEIFK